MNSRPRSFEKRAVETLLSVLRDDNALAGQPGFRIHVAHLSNSELVPDLVAAAESGVLSKKYNTALVFTVFLGFCVVMVNPSVTMQQQSEM